MFFDTFGIIDAMTGGGPAKATETLVYKVFFDGRLGGDLGGSAAQSVILMIMVIALTAVQFRYIERKVTVLMVEHRGRFGRHSHRRTSMPAGIGIAASSPSRSTRASSARRMSRSDHRQRPDAA